MRRRKNAIDCGWHTQSIKIKLPFTAANTLVSTMRHHVEQVLQQPVAKKHFIVQFLLFYIKYTVFFYFSASVAECREAQAATENPAPPVEFLTA